MEDDVLYTLHRQEKVKLEPYPKSIKHKPSKKSREDHKQWLQIVGERRKQFQFDDEEDCE